MLKLRFLTGCEFLLPAPQSIAARAFSSCSHNDLVIYGYAIFVDREVQVICHGQVF